MNKKANVLRKISIGFLCVSIALAIAGTILMFFAYERHYSGYFYTGLYYLSLPEAGIMPLVGTVLLIVALILTFLSKKKPNTAIGAMVVIFFAQALFASSVAVMIDAWNEEPWIGYFLCVGAAGLLSIVFWLMLFYRIFVNRTAGKTEGGIIAYSDYAKRLRQAADVLRELKSLYDNGIFTQAEYIRAKREAIERFEVYPIKETPAHPPQQ